MARRLADLDVDRGPAVDLVIDGESVRAHGGDCIAEAAWCAGQQTLSRSLKYHRPRGAFCFEGHCSGCLMRVDGVPNVRTCLEPCRDGQVVTSQNALPSAQLDALGVVDFIFGKKLDHHTLMTSVTPLNRVANKVVRQLSGLGTLPDRAGMQPAVREVCPDVCVIGGGPAGLAAAIAAASAGADVVLVDDQRTLGGSLRALAGGNTRVARLAMQARELGVELAPQATAIGYFAEEDVLAVALGAEAWRIAARNWIWASGGYAMNLPLIDNDRPGVLAARAVARLLHERGILLADRAVVIWDERPGAQAEANALAASLRVAGAMVTTVAAASVARVIGSPAATGVVLVDGDLIEAGLVAVAATPAPASEGARQHGCAVELSPSRGGYRVIVDGDGRTTVAGVWACGDVTGYMGPELALVHGAHVGAAVVATRRPQGLDPLRGQP